MDRREKIKREQRKAEALRWRELDELTSGVPNEEDWLEAIVREYGIKSLHELNKITEVYLYCRVSDRHQNLGGQVRGAVRKLTKEGIVVRHVWSEISNGSILDRPELLKAMNKTKESGMPLVAPAFSRFLRNKEYHPKYNPTARPTITEMKVFMRMANGGTLATINEPNSSPIEDETFLREMSARVGRKKTEMIKRKSRKERWLPKILKMVEKMSLREIMDELFTKGVKISYTTIANWVQESSGVYE